MTVLRVALILLLAAFAWASDSEWPERVLMHRRAEIDQHIVSGNVIDIKNAPHQLSFQRYDGHICGASIISKSFGITAAHCAMATNVKGAKIRAGSSVHNKGGAMFDLKRLVSHSKYNKQTVDYDMAILEIDGEFQLGEGVQIIALPKAGEDGLPGKFLYVSGWGNIKEGVGVSGTPVLREVQVVGLTQKVCALTYNGKLTNRMLCAGRSGADSCQGDSGGPLVHKEKSGTKLVGVVSWGYGCARKGVPGVYARVADPDLRAFITQVSGL